MKRSQSAAMAFATAVALQSSFLIIPPAQAGWPNDPKVNVRVSLNNNPRYLPDIASDGQGGAFVAWHDQRDFGTNGQDIYVQRVTDRGTVASGWPVDGVALCTAPGNQTRVVVVSDAAGGAYVAWHDERAGSSADDIYATRVLSDGSVAAGWPVNGLAVCTATGEQTGLTGAPDDFGGLFLVWTDPRNGNDDIYGHRLEPGGTFAPVWGADGTQITTDIQNQFNPRCAANGFGGLLVVWEDARGATVDIYGDHRLPNSASIWPPGGLAFCTAVGNQATPIVVADGAGGAVAVWQDRRTGAVPGIFAVRMTSVATLAAGWVADGVEIRSTTTGGTGGVAAVPDGTGGAIAAWIDFRTPGGDVYAGRIDGAGVPQWTPDGNLIADIPHTTIWVDMLSDGVGGAIIAWEDYRAIGSADIMSARVTSSGTLADGWIANGMPISSASANQTRPQLASDGQGGAIAAFGDLRGFGADVYAQRIDRFGQLGAQPTLVAVKDVPNDQGGQVNVSWTASPLDAYPSYTIDNYRVLRSVPAATASQLAETPGPDLLRLDPRYVGIEDHGGLFFWEEIATVGALQVESYNYIAPTTGDSIDGSNPLTSFMVQARTVSGDKWWFSDPDSGYSVDNLAPATPSPFTGTYDSGATTLHWGENQESDFSSYRLHRGASSDFVPAASNLVTEQPDTGYVDTAGSPHYYKLAAVDRHGNLSPFALLSPELTIDVPSTTSGRLWLGLATPNPTRGSVAMSFGLSRSGRVSLVIVDLVGRQVRELIEGELSAGEHRLHWDGTDADRRRAPNGLYFVQLVAEGRRLSGKIVVTR